MYSLAYVEGINNTDTPTFSNIQDQENYFASKVIKTIDDYFPPYYTNKISLAREDITINIKANYLILEYDNKIYYYFISDFRYVNEDLIEISITMDVIQSYMFDINYHSAHITRRTIKRWNDDGTINRSYIRENYGSNIFVKKELINNPNNLDEIGFLLYYKPTKSTSTETHLSTIYNYRGFSIGEGLYIIPFLTYSAKSYYNNNNTLKVEVRYSSDTSYHETTVNSFKSNINDALIDPEVTKAVLIPYNYFDNVKILEKNINDTLVYTMDFNDTIDFEGKQFVAIFDWGIVNKPYNRGSLVYSKQNKVKSRKYNLEFTQNTSNTKINFSYKYIPQLIDENYINISYGYRFNLTTYPLSKMNNIYLYCYTDVNFSTGATIFTMQETDKSYNIEDPYLVTNIVDPIPIPLYTDAWKTYYANNSIGVWLRPVLDIFGASTPTYKGNYDNSVTTSNRYSKKYPDRITSQKTRTLTKSSFKLSGLEGIADAVGTLSSYADLAFAPTKVRQATNQFDDYYSNNLEMILLTTYVNNIEMVATIYESIGYLQDEYVTGSPIFNDRKLYNYIACDNMDISLNILNSNEIINNITDRFAEGLRFWNIDLMTEWGLQLGEVCVYDNIEQ